MGFPRWVWTGQELFHFVNRILGGDEHNVEKAVSEFQKLFRENDAMITQNVEHTINLLVEEEIWITPFYSSRTFQAAAKGAPIEFLLNMKEGALSFISNPAIVANRPKESEDLAFKFIDSTLEEEAQINFARATGYPPTNLDAIKSMPDDVADKVGRFTEEDLAGLGTLQRQFDYTAMFEVSDAMFERWKKEILRA